MWCFYRNLIPQWKLISNSKFQKKILSPQNDYWKKFFRNPPGRKTLDSKTDQFVGKYFTSKCDIFLKIHFKFVIFNEKFYFKIMPFKISPKSEKFVVFPGTNWVRTFFSDVNLSSKSDLSIKIELKTWVPGK